MLIIIPITAILPAASRLVGVPTEIAAPLFDAIVISDACAPSGASTASG